MRSNSLWMDGFRRLLKNRLALVCLVIIAFYFIIAILAKLGIIGIHYATEIGPEYQPPSSKYWFGTDIFGYDVFSKVIHGTRVAISVGFISCLIAIPLGVFFGAISGYFGGIIDEIIVWFYSSLSSIPYILLLIAIAWVIGRGIFAIYIAVGVTTWVGLCRLIRAEFMKHKERDYVVASQAIGAGHFRRMMIHILPNVFHIVIIQFSLQFIAAIKAEVVLSYLGLGVQGQPSWGVMISDAKQELFRGVWWQLAGSTLAMFFLVLSFNVVGDAMRDALDPKLKGTK